MPSARTFSLCAGFGRIIEPMVMATHVSCGAKYPRCAHDPPDVVDRLLGGPDRPGFMDRTPGADDKRLLCRGPAARALVDLFDGARREHRRGVDRRCSWSRLSRWLERLVVGGI